MLIYLIIAAELAILYTVFWYVYVKDPKPYKVKGPLWGRYGQSGYTTGSVDPTLLCTARSQLETVKWWQSPGDQESYPDSVQYNGGAPVERANTLRYRRTMLKRFPLKHAAADCLPESTESAGAAPTLFNRVFMMFDRTLDALNVKTN